MVTAGDPHYGPMLEMDPGEARQAISERMVLALEVARHASPRMKPAGTLLLLGGTGGRRISGRLGIVPAVTAAVHLMANTAITGATYDIDGGQQFV
jgi:hypothetical protein